jgi:nitrite reductase/ring-hydroxylating ferredoxin subunit
MYPPQTQLYPIQENTNNHQAVEKILTRNYYLVLHEFVNKVCASDTLGSGEKMLVNFSKESVVVIRSSTGLQAVSARCPHAGVNLIDGFHDEQYIYCPGHGVAYCLNDGSSKCDLLKLQVYKVYECDGQIFLLKVTNK